MNWLLDMKRQAKDNFKHNLTSVQERSGDTVWIRIC